MKKCRALSSSFVKTASFQCRLVYTYNVLWSNLASHVYVNRKRNTDVWATSAQTRTPQSSLNCFCTNPSSRSIAYQAGILALLRNRLRLNDITLSLSSLLVVLRDLSAWFSIFDTANLTDLGSKTGYCRIRGLKMSNNWHDVSIPITILRLPNVESGRRPIRKIF